MPQLNRIGHGVDTPIALLLRSKGVNRSFDRLGYAPYPRLALERLVVGHENSRSKVDCQAAIVHRCAHCRVIGEVGNRPAPPEAHR